MSTITPIDPSQIEWAEPAPRVYAALSAKAAPFLEALRQHPNEWAIFRHDAVTGKVNDLRHVKGVEITSRPNGDGTSTVFARWVGVDASGETIVDPDVKARREARAAKRAATMAAKRAAENGA